jgi:hypothetical protein
VVVHFVAEVKKGLEENTGNPDLPAIWGQTVLLELLELSC